MASEQRAVSRLIAQAGQMLLAHGAESTLVGDIMRRIGLASGMNEVEVSLSASSLVITTVYDNLALFRCADYVVSDYGGTPFGALYLDKNLLLLNVPDAESDALTGDDSPDILLREEIVNVDEHARWSLPELLADDALWAAQAKVRQRLRHTYFVNSYGFSAEMAVMALCNIETLLTQG